jgi:hypothetical protein
VASTPVTLLSVSRAQLQADATFKRYLPTIEKYLSGKAKWHAHRMKEVPILTSPRSSSEMSAVWPARSMIGPAKRAFRCTPSCPYAVVAAQVRAILSHQGGARSGCCGSSGVGTNGSEQRQQVPHRGGAGPSRPIHNGHCHQPHALHRKGDSAARRRIPPERWCAPSVRCTLRADDADIASRASPRRGTQSTARTGQLATRNTRASTAAAQPNVAATIMRRLTNPDAFVYLEPTGELLPPERSENSLAVRLRSDCPNFKHVYASFGKPGRSTRSPCLGRFQVDPS